MTEKNGHLNIRDVARYVFQDNEAGDAFWNSDPNSYASTLLSEYRKANNSDVSSIQELVKSPNGYEVAFKYLIANKDIAA
jgi:hypothetical protein